MRQTKLPAVVLALLLPAATFAAGCARDDGASVRNSAGGSSAVSGSSTAAGCKEVGASLESKAKTTVTAVLRDFSIDLSKNTVPAGITTFKVSNKGSHDHELAFLPGGGEVPLTAAGHPDEKALSKAGAFELQAIGPGTDCNGTWKLAPGTYTVFCVIETNGVPHVSKGMQARLTVT